MYFMYFLFYLSVYGMIMFNILRSEKVVISDRNRKIVSIYNGGNLDKLRVRYGISVK